MESSRSCYWSRRCSWTLLAVLGLGFGLGSQVLGLGLGFGSQVLVLGLVLCS